MDLSVVPEFHSSHCKIVSDWQGSRSEPLALVRNLVAPELNSFGTLPSRQDTEREGVYRATALGQGC